MLDMEYPETKHNSAFSSPRRSYVDMNWVNSLLQYVGEAIDLENERQTIYESIAEQYNQDKGAILAQENAVYDFYQKRLADEQAQKELEAELAKQKEIEAQIKQQELKAELAKQIESDEMLAIKLAKPRGKISEKFDYTKAQTILFSTITSPQAKVKKSEINSHDNEIEFTGEPPKHFRVK